jgi:hypothetical protein
LNPSKQSVIIFESNSYPYGISYEEWIRLWWKWLISIPKGKNPAFDNTGDQCNISQDNPHVWFLAGTFGDVPAIRKCTVPEGKALLFPVINYECSFADAPSFRSEQELEEKCKQEMDQIGNMNASLDARKINVHDYRVHSRCFTVNIPPDNCLGAVSGTTRIASDGFWLFIEPLPPGTHTLISYGSCMAGKIKIDCTFQLVIE